VRLHTLSHGIKEALLKVLLLPLKHSVQLIADWLEGLTDLLPDPLKVGSKVAVWWNPSAVAQPGYMLPIASTYSKG
jgi:hypothetical protein